MPTTTPTAESSSVQRPETNVGSPATHPIPFRHSGWNTWRNRVLQAFVATTQTRSRIDRFTNCGNNAWLAYLPHPRNTYIITTDCCHDRFCAPCTTRKAAQASAVLQDHLRGRKIRFLTLTIRTSRLPLATALTKLTHCFRLLRQRPLWNRHVTGGAAFAEVKWNRETDRWHPHLHVLIEGTYFPQEALKTAWHAVTGDSYIVDIRDVPDVPKLADYVAKYATKGYSSDLLHTPARLEEAITALASRRLMITFGAWRGLRLSAKPDPTVPIPLAPLPQIVRLADSGEPWARQVLRHLADPAHEHSPGPPPENLGCGVLPPYSNAPANSRKILLIDDTTAAANRAREAWLDQHFPVYDPPPPGSTTAQLKRARDARHVSDPDATGAYPPFDRWKDPLP